MVSDASKKRGGRRRFTEASLTTSEGAMRLAADWEPGKRLVFRRRACVARPIRSVVPGAPVRAAAVVAAPASPPTPPLVLVRSSLPPVQNKLGESTTIQPVGYIGGPSIGLHVQRPDALASSFARHVKSAQEDLNNRMDLSFRAIGLVRLPLLFRRTGTQIQRLQRPGIVALSCPIPRQTQAQQTGRLGFPKGRIYTRRLRW